MTALPAILLAAAAACAAVPPMRTERRLDTLSLRYPRSAASGAESGASPVQIGGRPPRSGRPPGHRQARRRSGRRVRRQSLPPASGPKDTPQDTPLLLRPPARTGMALAAGAAIALTVGGTVGVVLGLAAVLTLPRVIARLPDPTAAARDRRLAADVPLALDLIAACLSAGAPFPQAVRAVSADLPGPLSSVLADVGAQLDLGAPQATAWRRAAGLAPLQALLETVNRVGDSGAALAPALRQLATDERERSSQAQQAAVRRIGVFVVIPLGICFLPAFLLLGVVPIVAGLIGGLVV